MPLIMQAIEFFRHLYLLNDVNVARQIMRKSNVTARVENEWTFCYSGRVDEFLLADCYEMSSMWKLVICK